MALVVAATDPRDAAQRRRALEELKPPTHPLPSEVALVFARLLDRASGADAARALLASIARAPLLGGDALVTPVAVDLVARGLLDVAALPADARVELAARRGESPDAAALAAVDARHQLLVLALLRPADRATLDLARHLAHAADHDAVVAVALTRMALAGVAVPRTDGLGALDPADPLVAAAALDLAVKQGNVRAIPGARARLISVARTPAERARAVE
jgi:hypothetical protein